MLDIPNLPTDNLYKFAALAGVTTTLVSMYIQYRLAEFFFKDAETVLMDMVKSRRNEPVVMTIPALDAEMKTLQTEKEIIQIRQDAFNWRYGHTTPTRYLCIVFMSIGMVVSTWGFYNWSLRVQSYQDELLKLQVEAARQEAKRTPAHP